MAAPLRPLVALLAGAALSLAGAPATAATANPNVCEPCVAAPDTCCAKVPVFSVEAPVFSPNIVVATREPVATWPYPLTIYDLGSAPPSPLEDENWAGILRFNGPFNSWNVDSLGNVFGLTIDKYGNIFAAHTSCYSIDSLSNVFNAGPGAVYRIDSSTGKITTFVKLPNFADSAWPDQENWPGLGNISYDCRHDQFFVTDLEDGRIYRVQPTVPNAPTGFVAQVFDPMGADNGAPGFAPVGERLWAVQVHAGRVYYSVWNQDFFNPTGNPNEIRSVALDGSGAMQGGTDQHELWLPPLGAGSFSMPVSDISFSLAGKMLIGERSMQGPTYPFAHLSRVLEYACSNLCWTPANSYSVGQYTPENSAGGVDYDGSPFTLGKLGRVWASADQIHGGAPYPDVVYGYLGLRPTGGTITTSMLIDADTSVITYDKSNLGDIEVVGCPGAVGTICGHKFRDHNHNGVFDVSDGDQWLPNWTVTLSGSSGTFTAMTDANGQFCFLNVPPGTYTLSEFMQAGWVQTSPASGGYTVTVAAGQVITNLDFGNDACGAEPPCAPPPSGMVAWWPFSETPGTLTTKDLTHLVPLKNVAQLFGGAAIVGGGFSGNMLCVPGELDYVKVPNAGQAALSFGAGPFAIDAWVKLNGAFGNQRMLVEKRVPVGANTRGWAVWFNGTQLFLQIGYGIGTQLVPGPSVTAGVWNHIAVSVERSPAAGRWYVNGIPQPSFNFVPTPGSISPAGDLYIGATGPSFPIGSAFDGCIDNLEIFASPLPAATVLRLHQAGNAGKCSDDVRLPQITAICSSQSSVSVCFSICNNAATTASYHWSLAALAAGAGCSVAGPTSFSPSSGTVTVLAGGCSPSICVTIPRPAGLTAQNATSCYQLTVMNDSTGICQSRPGTIRADNTCWCATATNLGLTSVRVIGVPVGWEVGNPCGNGAALPYRVIARWETGDYPDPLLVSLNGLPQGEPVTGTLTLGPGGQEEPISVQVGTPHGYDLAALYEIVLEADTDGDGVYERIGGSGIHSEYVEDLLGVPPLSPGIVTLGMRARPNPFSRGARIALALPKAGSVELGVYDVTGRLARRLHRGLLPAGARDFEWDGRDGSGHELPDGIYFVRLRAGDAGLETKIVKLR